MPQPGLQTQIDPTDTPLFEAILALGHMISAGRQKFGQVYVRECSAVLQETTTKIMTITKRYNRGSILRKPS